MHIILKRHTFLEKETLGTLLVINERGKCVFDCCTIELAYRDNKKGISSVPEGTYPLVLEYSPRFNTLLWELKKVPDRSEVKIHVANYYRQLEGCIAVGDMFIHLDDDEFPDLRNSRITLNRLHEVLGISPQVIQIIK